MIAGPSSPNALGAHNFGLAVRDIGLLRLPAPLNCLGRGQVSESGPGGDDLMTLADSRGLAHRPRGSAGPVGSEAVGPSEDGGSAD